MQVWVPAPHHPAPSPFLHTCSHAPQRLRIERHRSRACCGALEQAPQGDLVASSTTNPNHDARESHRLTPPPSIQTVLLEQQHQQQLLQGHGEPVADPGPGSGKLQPQDYTKFVQFFRHASPYIAGHRGRTFVIVVPGNVSGSPIGVCLLSVL